MDLLLIITALIIVLDLAALRWGADSRDGLNSSEWFRRQAWRGFH